MTFKNRSLLTTWLGWSLIVILFDQFTKVLIVGNFELGQSHVVTSFFNLVRAHNAGAAFSFLNVPGGAQRWLFTGIAVAAIALILWQLGKHSHQRLFSFALASILGGAIGNLLDRLRLGYVVDFLDFYWSETHFAAFNIADSAITLGAACLILDEFVRVRQARR